MKMKKPGKNKSTVTSWEGPYQFVGYKDGKGCQEQDQGVRNYILRDKDGQTWQRPKHMRFADLPYTLTC